MLGVNVVFYLIQHLLVTLPRNLVMHYLTVLPIPSFILHLYIYIYMYSHIITDYQLTEGVQQYCVMGIETPLPQGCSPAPVITVAKSVFISCYAPLRKVNPYNH